MIIILWIIGIVLFLFALLFVAAEMNMPIPPEHGVIVTILTIPFYFIVVGLYIIASSISDLLKKFKK